MLRRDCRQCLPRRDGHLATTFTFAFADTLHCADGTHMRLRRRLALLLRAVYLVAQVIAAAGAELTRVLFESGAKLNLPLAGKVFDCAAFTSRRVHISARRGNIALHAASSGSDLWPARATNKTWRALPSAFCIARSLTSNTKIIFDAIVFACLAHLSSERSRRSTKTILFRN